MGILLAFAMGYAVGARGGVEGYEEVVGAMKAVRDSDEFRALVSALRHHVSFGLREVSDLVAGESEPISAQDVVDRVRRLVRFQRAAGEE